MSEIWPRTEIGAPRVSVVIPTKNRATDLAITVDSLLVQTRVPSELIIVDQSADRSFCSEISIPVRYIHDPGITGAATARNAGMDVVTGEIILFLDDDVILEPDFIEQIVAAYSPDVVGVSGVVTNYVKPPVAQRFWSLTFMRGPFFDDRQPIYWNFPHLQFSGPIPVHGMGAGLMSFRAEAVKSVRFDSNLTGASPGEDIDFCASMPPGSKLVLTPKAKLFHKKSPEARAAVHWLTLHAQVYYYMRERHWRKGVWNNLCFAWLNVGYTLAASLSCLKRVSLAPWRAWREGAQKGYRIAHPEMQASNSQ